MLINLRNALMAGKNWKNPYQTSDNMLIAMWDGLQGGFTELFGHTTTETSIVRTNNGIYCTASNSNISISDFVYGSFGSFSIEYVYSGFAVQSRRNFFNNSANSRGFTFFNLNNSNGASFETRLEYQTTGLNDQLQYQQQLPSSGTGGCFIESKNTGIYKAIFFNGGIVTSRTSWRTFLDNNGISISPFLRCTIHCIRIYSRALTADEIARNYAIDKARFGLS